MSHPDPLFDSDNAYDDDDMYDHDDIGWTEADDSDVPFAEHLYDDYRDFYDDSFDDSMDGDMESGLASAGWGTDEDYGYYGDDTPMSDDYYGGE